MWNQSQRRKRTRTDLVEVEGIVAGDGAVEARLEEGRPAVAELVRPAAVVAAHAGDPRVHRLPFFVETPKKRVQSAHEQEGKRERERERERQREKDEE